MTRAGPAEFFQRPLSQRKICATDAATALTVDRAGGPRSATRQDAQPADTQKGGVGVVSGQAARSCRHWQSAFALQHKDRRYYEIVEDTIHPEFDYRCFIIRDTRGEIRALQPFFILDQDILVGIRPYLGPLIDAVRARCPRFLFMKTMMVGCAAGEAHLDDAGESARAVHAELLAGAIERHAHALGARLIVLKEFPRQYRGVLSCFARRGFTRIPACR